MPVHSFRACDFPLKESLRVGHVLDACGERGLRRELILHVAYASVDVRWCSGLARRGVRPLALNEVISFADERELWRHLPGYVVIEDM